MNITDAYSNAESLVSSLMFTLEDMDNVAERKNFIDTELSYAINIRNYLMMEYCRQL